MASDETLRTVITVLDKTAVPISQINARFAAMSAPLKQISSRIAELGELAGIGRIGESASRALEHVRGLGEGLLHMAEPLVALGAAASAAGVVEIVKSTAEFAEKLAISSAKTGIATEQLAGWHYAAGLVNVDVDQLDKGFGFLNRSISEAAMGKAKDVEQILRRMGFSNTPGHLVNTSEALKAVAAEVQHLAGGGQIQLATDMMAKLFGGRRGAELLPLFEQGPEGLTKALGAAREAGISLTASQAAAGSEFMENLKGMQASVEGLKIAIGNELFPVLGPVIEGFKEWLNDNRAEIAQDLGDAVKYLARQLHDIDWAKVNEGLKEFGADAKWAFDKIGGVKGVLEVIAAINLAPTIAAFTQLGVVMATNPIGLALLAAGLLALEAYEIYQNWDKIKGLWDKLPEGAKIAVAGISTAFAPFIKLPLEIIANWQKLESFFVGIPGWGKGGDSMAVPGGGYIDPGSGMFFSQPPLSALPPAGGGAPRQGLMNIFVKFLNSPPGMSVSTESRGNLPAPIVNVGEAMPFSSQ